MATPSKTPPIPLPDWDTVVTKTPTVNPTVPKSVTVPTTVPKTTGPALPDWDTGGTTTPAAGSTLPVRTVTRNIADAELRGAQRDLNQARRAAERSGVSGQTVENIVERKEPNVGLKVLGILIDC